MERLLELLTKIRLNEEEAQELLNLLFKYIEERRRTNTGGITSSQTCKHLT